LIPLALDTERRGGEQGPDGMGMAPIVQVLPWIQTITAPQYRAAQIHTFQSWAEITGIAGMA
jgi:hypothetical protein